MPDEALQQPKHKTVGIFENYQEIIPDDKLSYFENAPSITLHVAPQGAPMNRWKQIFLELYLMELNIQVWLRNFH